MTAKKKDQEKPCALRPLRKRGVPLVAIETPDPAATQNNAVDSLANDETPAFSWDIVRGMRALNECGVTTLEKLLGDKDPLILANATEALNVMAENTPAKALFFFHNAHLLMSQNGQPVLTSIQAIWNCRDKFAKKGATLVLLAPIFIIPPELSRDVVVLTEDLPSRDELARVVDDMCESAELEAPKDEERKGVIDTLTGLSKFEAEQTIALSFTKSGIDRQELWKRKVRAIEQTQGLTVYRGKEKLADVAGNRNAIRLMSDTLRGKLDCTCIVFADELDKGMAAAGTDTSGTTQDQNKALLSYLQDYDAIAALFLGPPGTGKTLLAKALSGEFNKPLIMLDLGALKGSLVGQSEQNMRQALRVIHAISEGKALWIGACNRDAGLPPELRRRFSYQLLYFDLPNRDEKDAAWNVHTQRLMFRGQTVCLREDQTDRSAVNDDGWTGAEIRNCALKAYAMDIPLKDAARTIVPISKSAGDLVTALRRSANGRYVSASQDGIYTYREQSEADEPATRRKLNIN